MIQTRSQKISKHHSNSYEHLLDWTVLPNPKFCIVNFRHAFAQYCYNFVTYYFYLIHDSNKAPENFQASFEFIWAPPALECTSIPVNNDYYRTEITEGKGSTKSRKTSGESHHLFDKFSIFGIASSKEFRLFWKTIWNLQMVNNSRNLQNS